MHNTKKPTKIYSHRYIRNLDQWSLQKLHDYLVSIDPLVDYAYASGNEDALPITCNTRHFMMKLMRRRFDNGEPLFCNGKNPATGHKAKDGTPLDQFHEGKPCIFCAPEFEAGGKNWFGVRSFVTGVEEEARRGWE